MDTPELETDPEVSTLSQFMTHIKYIAKFVNDSRGETARQAIATAWETLSQLEEKLAQTTGSFSVGDDRLDVLSSGDEMASLIQQSTSSAAQIFRWLLTGALLLFVLLITATASRWVIWILFSVTMFVIQFWYLTYQVCMIAVDLFCLSVMKTCHTVLRTLRRSSKSRAGLAWSKCETLHEFRHVAEKEDNKLETRAWRLDDSDYPQSELLRSTAEKLARLREAGAHSELQYLLTGLLKRNHLGIDEPSLHQALLHSKNVVEDFQAEVARSLEALAGSADMPVADKVSFFRKARRALGQTALCLSGGGAITMYHQGVVKGLMEAGIYDTIKVISGTSGGSITAAMLACKTPQQLREEVIVDHVSTDYLLTGVMAKENIRWFPPLLAQLFYFMRNRFLMDSEYFMRTCRFYWGDITFEEAYAMTGKHVCITVSASRSSQGLGPQRLLLNHITTPHVTLASAVATSCSLPGIMRGAKLEVKNAMGKLEPFEVDGVEWIDGSVQADVPFKRMSSLFNVSVFIVSQVNPHVVPFIHKAHTPSQSSWYWKLFSALDFDIRHRARQLSSLNLMPRFYGENLGKIFSQKYHGDITIVPKMRPSEMLGLKAILNPTRKDMQHYIVGGQRATWPHISRVQHMMLMERTVAKCCAAVKQQAARGAPPRPPAVPGLTRRTRSLSQPSQAEEEEEAAGPASQRSSLDGEAPRGALGSPSSSGIHRAHSTGSFLKPRQDSDTDDMTDHREFHPSDDDEDMVRRPRAPMPGAGGKTHFDWQLLQAQVERLTIENADLRARLESITELCGGQPQPRRKPVGHDSKHKHKREKSRDGYGYDS